MMNDLFNILHDAKSKPLLLTHQPTATQHRNVISYQSLHDDRIFGHVFEASDPSKHAWMVLFHGLGAHTLTPGYLEFVSWWNEQGYDVIGMDCRHQGGLTKGYPPVHPQGLYLSGLDHLSTYYYTALYVDAYRLIDVARTLKPDHHIYVTGGSQGGALALFAGATHPDVALVMADMPSNTDIHMLISSSTGGFKAFLDHGFSAPEWLVPNIDLLSYASIIKKPVLLASGSDDRVCPIETAETLFKQLQSDKMFYRYEHFGHGGYDDLHFPRKLEFIRTFQTKSSR